MRLGLIGGSDSKRTSGVYKLSDVLALQDAKKYVTRFGYDNVFNALASSGVEEGFDVSRDGRYVYVAVRGTRTAAAIFQYECSTPWSLSTIAYSGKSLVVGDWELDVNSVSISDDGTKLYFAGYGYDTVWSATLSTPYDLATAVVDVKRLYAGGQDTTSYTPVFGDSGTKLYVSGTANDRIYQYDLSVAWDVSTAVYSNKSLLVTAIDATPGGIYFKSDGTKVYGIGFTNNIVFSYTLSTPWDISTGVADYVLRTLTVSTQTTLPWDVRFSSDGTKAFVLSGAAATTDTVFQYNLSTPWRISTGTYSNVSFVVNGQDTACTGLFFKNDGTKMYVIGQTTDTIYQYTLSTAWDLSTVSYDSISFSVSGQELTPTGVFIGNSGSSMYVIGATGDDINEYSLSTPWVINTASFVRVSAVVGDTQPNGLHFSSDGTKLSVLGGQADAVRLFTLGTAWDVSTISFIGSYPAPYLDSALASITFSDDGFEMYMTGQTASAKVFQLTLSVPWDPRSVIGRFSVNAEDTAPRSLYIKPDGTKMYVTGVTGDDINEYDLAVPWDISSSLFLQVSASVGDATPTSLWFKDDGSKVYIIGQTNDAVRQFTLNTPWNVSSLVFDKALSVGFEASPTGVAFKDDGSILYVSGAANDCVYQIPLGTAWDIGTAQGYVYVGTNETVTRGIHLISDGTALYLSGNGSNIIRKYTLATPYQLGTASSSQSFALSAVYGIHVNKDGTRIYAVVSSASTVAPTGTGRMVRVINLTTPHDLTTATLSNTEWIPLYGLTGVTAGPWDVRLSQDETRMWVLSDVVQGLYQFSLRFA